MSFLDQLFSSTLLGTSLSISKALILLGVATVLGLLIGFTYILTHRKSGYMQSFLVTLIMLPAIVTIIILLLQDNMLGAISLGGAFALIRFRTTLREPKDLAFIFFTIAVGLGCGMGYIAYAVVFGLFLCLVMLILDRINFGHSDENTVSIKVTVPENLNFQGLLDDIMAKYADSYVMKKVRTVDFGSLFELTYRVRLKNNVDQKAMIDEIRTRNGNLNVAVVLYEYDLPMRGE